MNVFELVDEHFKMQQGGKKYPPLSSFYKDKPQERIPSREDNNLQLLINETNLAKQDKDELNRTGQIKNPRSIHYKKLAPKQAEVKQDNISTEQRNAQLNPLQRPLIYLANPEKLLGDIGVPNMETSELDRQAIAGNTYNTNQTREERFLNNAKLGLGYVPEATINTALAATFMPEGTGALGLVNEALNPLAGLKTSIPDELRQGLRANGLTFNGTPREFPINNYQRTANEDVERLFKEFPELGQIGSKEDYIKHLESIYPESTQPGIFYRGSKNPNLNVSEWTPNPSGGNNLGQGFYFTPDPFKAEKYGKEMKALLDIKNPTYTSLRLNNNAFNMPSGIMTKDLVKDGSALISIENPNRNFFTGMGSRDEGYIHKYIGDLNEQGFPVADIPYPDMPNFKEYPKVDELAVPSTSQIHILGSEQDLEGFKKYVNNTGSNDKFQSEINWGQWNKEIPDNPQLMKEYNAIEQQSKANGSWMKNPDGSVFQGTPEQFVQQNSENFKKSFPNGFEQTYRGTQGESPMLKPNRAMFTGSEDLARGYTSFENPLEFLNSEEAVKRGGTHNLIYPKSENSLVHDTRNSDWQHVNLSSVEDTQKNIDKNIERISQDIERKKNMAKTAKQHAEGYWEFPNSDIKISDRVFKEGTTREEQELQKLIDIKNNGFISTNPKLLSDIKNKLGNQPITDDIAKYIEDYNIDNITLKNIHDGSFGDISIINHKSGNYLKSKWGNNGMFDMTNPSIYKSIVPIAGASYLATQGQESKQQGGTYTENEKKFLEEFAQMKLI